MTIAVQNISKRYGTFDALKDVSLEVGKGELVALLGPSGSGKTTLLRIIAGLEFAESGSVLFHGDDAGNQSVRDRRVGFVFQHYALFKHMTVFENVAFGLRVRPRKARPSKSDIRARVLELLRLVQLENLAERHPAQLSGGQRQRVALARALAIEPKVLLLDEPFGALDAQVRRELRRWLRRLHDEIQLTSVFVTHDQEEALELADRVVVMNRGQIEQVGTPEQVYHQPATPFVYGFLGSVNLFHGRVEAGEGGEPEVRLVSPQDRPSASGRRPTARVFVRPHSIDLDRATGSIPARVDAINAAGPAVRVELTSERGEPVLVELTQERFQTLELNIGDSVYATPRESRVFLD